MFNDLPWVWRPSLVPIVWVTIQIVILPPSSIYYHFVQFFWCITNNGYHDWIGSISWINFNLDEVAVAWVSISNIELMPISMSDQEWFLWNVWNWTRWTFLVERRILHITQCSPFYIEERRKHQQWKQPTYMYTTNMSGYWLRNSFWNGLPKYVLRALPMSACANTTKVFIPRSA